MFGDNMNKHALLHRPKSEYAYAFDEKTVQILFRSAKDYLTNVKLIYGDPFMWNENGWVYNIAKMNKRYSTELFDYYFIAIEPKDLRVKYAFLINDKNDNKLLYGSKRIVSDYNSKEKLELPNYFNFPYLNIEDLNHTPKWVKDTVWYHIFPDRFFTNKPKLNWNNKIVNNHEIYGGDLNGIKSKLPYLKNLGVTGIYLTPIFESNTAHKYDTINYFNIDPSFGTNEDFKKLVEEAHKVNIKIMLDGVFNHSGYLHPFFQDVMKKGEKSKYKDSFHILNFPLIDYKEKDTYLKLKDDSSRFDLNFRTFAYTPHMPKWNTHNKYTKEHLLDVVSYWIKEYDIDGWRLDVSNEISHDFLREIKKTARNLKKDIYILGENWDESIPWLMGDQMDAVMNYNLTTPMWDYLEHKISLKEFKNEVNHYLATTPKSVINNMFNLIDSHDTIRILNRLNKNVDRVKLAYLFMFLSSGAPTIYYGGEVLLEGEHDPQNRLPMNFNPNNKEKEFKQFIEKLIYLRNKYNSFKTPDYKFIESDILSFIKLSNDEELLVLINNNDENKSYKFTNNNSPYLNLFTNESQTYDKIVLKPYQFLVLLKE